eukprot:2298763-Alexandrium_andersonii.AAC.1
MFGGLPDVPPGLENPGRRAQSAAAPQVLSRLLDPPRQHHRLRLHQRPSGPRVRLALAGGRPGAR